MSMLEESPGRKALLQCTSELTSLMKHSLSGYSGKLLEMGLITEAVHDWVLTAQGVSSQDKAARLVSCLTDRVKGSTQEFHDFIEVLKGADPFCGDIVDKLSSLHGSFIALKITSEAEKEQVGKKIKQLEKQFSSLQRRLSSELNANSEVSPEILLESLTLLPIALRSEYQNIILENMPNLEKAESIRKIFLKLNPHSSFIDYHLVEYLVEEFGSDQLQEDMSAYVKLVQVFYDETTIQHLMDHWPGRRDIPPHFDELKAVIDADPGTYTLRQLDNLRKRFCNETKLSDIVLSLIGVGRKNSFVVRWVFPSIFLPQLKSVIVSLRSFYQTESILSVTIGSQRLYSIVAEYEERLLFLCSKGTGDISEFQYLLSQPGVDTNIYDKDGYTPLWYAAAYGRNGLLLLLLEHGAEVDLSNDDKWGSTALSAACIEGNVTTATLLIKRGAAVKYFNKQGKHPLTTASFNGKLETIKLLLDSGAEVDLPTNDDLGFTALLSATQEGHSDIARLLIERGAVVDYLNKAGLTPLHKASEKGYDVQVLLHAGASVDLPTKNEFCYTALCVACQHGHAKVVMTLISNKADVNYQTKDGWTALSLASYGGYSDTVRILVERGANTDMQNEDGLTALMLATRNSHAHVIKILLDAKADPNVSEKTSGWSTIFFAAEQGNVEITELLMKGGATLDIKDKNGLTAFDVAKSHDQQAVCDLLKTRGKKLTGKEATQEQKEQVKSSSQRLKKVFNFLERTLLKEKVKRKQTTQQVDDKGAVESEGHSAQVPHQPQATAKATDTSLPEEFDQQPVRDLLEKYENKESEKQITQQVDNKGAEESEDHSAQVPHQLQATPKETNTSLPEEFDFVEHPSEDFFCPVTFELLLHPHLTMCCGNHLSQRAVTRLKSEGKPCPICKEPDLATVLDKFHRRKVHAVQVHCPHTPSGCEWVGEVGELSQHIQTCLKQHIEAS